MKVGRGKKSCRKTVIRAWVLAGLLSLLCMPQSVFALEEQFESPGNEVWETEALEIPENESPGMENPEGEVFGDSWPEDEDPEGSEDQIFEEWELDDSGTAANDTLEEVISEDCVPIAEEAISEAFELIPEKESEITEPEEAETEAQGAFAEGETITSGTCGENMSWNCYPVSGKENEYYLSINGSYDWIESQTRNMSMDDYLTPEEAPWWPLRDSITEVRIYFSGDGRSQRCHIGANAFFGYDHLEKVTITTSKGLYVSGTLPVPDIGERAFANCDHLETVSLPDKIGEIGYAAFGSCGSLKGIRFGLSADHIGEMAFAGCDHLETVQMPLSITTVDDLAFGYCQNLRQVGFPGSVPEECGDMFSSSGDGGALTVQVSQQYQSWLETYCIDHPSPSITPIFIPNTIGDNCTWTIEADGTLKIEGNGALTSDSWPWLENSFIRNSIKRITVGEGITSLGDGAFGFPQTGVSAGTIGLSELSLPDSLKSIGNEALRGFYVTNGAIVVPAGVEQIGANAFCYRGYSQLIYSVYSSTGSSTSRYYEVKFNGPMPRMRDDTFGNWPKYKTVTICVPLGDDTWLLDQRVDGSEFHGGKIDWLGYEESRFGKGNAGYLTPEGLLYYKLGSSEWKNELSRQERGKVQEIQIISLYSLGNNTKYAEFFGDLSEQFPNLKSLSMLSSGSYSQSENGHLFGVTTKYEINDGTLTQVPYSLYFYSPLCEDEVYQLPETITSQDIRVFKNRKLKTLTVARETVLTGLADGEKPEGYDFTVKCYSGSSALTFCKEHGLAYEVVDSDWDHLAYSMPNASSSFGYGTGFRISETAYQRIWGKRYIAEYIRAQIKGWSGNCFGMSSSAIFSQANEQHMSADNYGKTSLSQLAVGDTNTYYSMSLREIFETLQVSQYTQRIQNAYWNNRGKICEISALAKQCSDTGRPVLIAMFEGTRRGHILVGYNLVSAGDSVDKLMVYDCNFPNDGSAGNADRYIELRKNGSGQYTGWYYRHNNRENWGNSYGNYWMTYVSYEDLLYVWARRGVLRSEGNYIATQASDALILDENDREMAIIQNGVLYANDASVREVISADTEGGSADGTLLIRLPGNGKYVIENRSTSGEALEVSFANTEKGVSVTTSADRVMLIGNDGQSICDATILSDKNDSYIITTNVLNEESQDEKTQSGTTGGHDVTASAGGNGTGAGSGSGSGSAGSGSGGQAGGSGGQAGSSNTQAGSSGGQAGGSGGHAGTSGSTAGAAGTSSDAAGNQSGSSGTGTQDTPSAVQVSAQEVEISISKAPSVSKLKAAAKGKVTFFWKAFKQTKKNRAVWKKIKKVEVQYSTDYAFRTRVSKLVGKKKTSLTVRNLKKNTIYYVRIRYTDGAGGYSAWSKVRRVRTKKK